MADDDLRRAEREWLADETDQAALSRWIEARRRAGLLVGHELLEKQVHPAGRLSPPVPGQVWIERPDGEALPLEPGEAVDCPEHRRAWLTLDRPEGSLAELGTLAGFQGLRLAVADPDALEGDLSRAEVTHLALHAGELDPDLLARLVTAPRLASLELMLEGPLTAEPLASLAAARHLSRVRIQAGFEPGALGALGAIRELSEVEAEDMESGEPLDLLAELEGLSRAANLTALHVPMLADEPDDALLEAIATSLPRLRTLVLPFGDAATDAGLAHVCRLPLEELDLRSRELGPAGLAGLPTSLRALTIKAPQGPLAWLARLTGLTRLHLELHPRTSDADLAALAGFARLTRLWLGFAIWGDATAAALEHLRGLPRLEGLDLSALPDLRPAREVLAALPLRELMLLDVGKLDDATLASYLPPGLVKLELMQCQGITEAGLRALIASRPGLVVSA